MSFAKCPRNSSFRYSMLLVPSREKLAVLSQLKRFFSGRTIFLSFDKWSMSVIFLCIFPIDVHVGRDYVIGLSVCLCVRAPDEGILHRLAVDFQFSLQRILSFEMNGLRRILRVSWTAKKRTERVLNKAGVGLSLEGTVRHCQSKEASAGPTMVTP